MSTIFQSGAICSQLMMLFLYDSLKFQVAKLQLHCYFLLKKCENPLHCKGFSHFFNKKYHSVFAFEVDI